ncbi:MAG TPA: S8 family serine peptidase, partial [Arenibaculum sp.]|nr:S8 family serine peptidase [Arenibaculum sp.]
MHLAKLRFVGVLAASTFLCHTGFAGVAAGDELTWNMRLIGVSPQLHSTRAKGSGIRVGVLDGYANHTHREFGTRLDRPWGSPGGTYTRYDDHGTHVAGIVGAAR